MVVLRVGCFLMSEVPLCSREAHSTFQSMLMRLDTSPQGWTKSTIFDFRFLWELEPLKSESDVKFPGIEN